MMAKEMQHHQSQQQEPLGSGGEVPKKMAATCEAHPFDEATDTCRSCGYDFCPECLVYAHGQNKPPYCVPCALTAAGVRSTAKRSPRSPEPRARKDRARRAGSHHVMSGKVAVGVAAAVTVASSAAVAILA